MNFKKTLKSYIHAEKTRYANIIFNVPTKWRKERRKRMLELSYIIDAEICKNLSSSVYKVIGNNKDDQYRKAGIIPLY